MVVTLGEIMMRLSPPDRQRFGQATKFDIQFGGSEANVAVSLSHLKINSAHVTRISNCDLGLSSLHWLRQHNVSADHITTGPERLGIYFLERGAMQRSSRVIYDRNNSAFANIQKGEVDWDTIMAKATWFHWSGITPAISQGAADVCLDALLAAKKFNIPVSGDINYRRNLWQYGKMPTAIMPELISHTHHVIGSTHDFLNCTGISGKDFISGCHAMLQHFPLIKSFATTVREQSSSSENSLSAVIFHDNQLFESHSWELTQIVDRIGAGDAFMAGYIFGWMKNYPPQRLIDFASAACAYKHSIEGDVNLATFEEIDQLVKGENVGKLLR